MLLARYMEASIKQVPWKPLHHSLQCTQRLYSLSMAPNPGFQFPRTLVQSESPCKKLPSKRIALRPRDTDISHAAITLQEINLRPIQTLCPPLKGRYFCPKLVDKNQGSMFRCKIPKMSSHSPTAQARIRQRLPLKGLFDDVARQCPGLQPFLPRQ